MIIDESHVTIGQLGGMYKGDRSRKENLVEYGFRLPSALDNRPLRFDEFEKVVRQTVFVSATPADYEREKSAQVVEQVVRPTGLVDPQVDGAPGRDAGGRPAVGDPRPRGQARARAGDHADQAHGGGTHRVSRRARREGALPALRGRDGGARGDHPRPAAGRVRRAGRHQPAARGPGPAGSVAGGDPRRGQGGLPALGALADPDHGPGRAAPQRQRDPVRGRDDRFDEARDRRDRAPAQQAARLQRAAQDHAHRRHQAHQGHDRGRLRRRRGGGRAARQRRTRRATRR